MQTWKAAIIASESSLHLGNPLPKSETRDIRATLHTTPVPGATKDGDTALMVLLIMVMYMFGLAFSFSKGYGMSINDILAAEDIFRQAGAVDEIICVFCMHRGTTVAYGRYVQEFPSLIGFKQGML